jgi:hypothetical protein
MQKCETCPLAAACVPIGMQQMLGDNWFSVCVKCRAVWRHEKGDASYTGGMNGRCHEITGHCDEAEAWIRRSRPVLGDCPACRVPKLVKGPRANHADHYWPVNTAVADGANIAGVAASLPTYRDEWSLGEGYSKEVIYTKFMIHSTGGKAWREERGQVVMIPVTRK